MLSNNEKIILMNYNIFWLSNRTFFDYPTEIRKMIYTTNTIENLNRNIRKITKTKSAFTNTQSLSKIIYMCLINIQEDYDSRFVHN